MSAELLWSIMLLLSLGAIAGFLAGLLGIGGGVVIVPGMYYILKHFGYVENAMHIAVGTALLTIIFTGTSSAYAHHKKNNLDKNLIKNFLPGVLIGSILGTYIADIAPSIGLKAIFACSQIGFGSYIILSRNKTHFFESMPKQPWFSLFSAANSCIATLMGVGRGVQNVTFMTICNIDIKKAIATAAALGPFIAIVGSFGFLYIGLDDSNLPPYNFGYINLAAFLIIITTSIASAPFGASLAHSLPVPKLKRYFAIFMMFIAAKMIFEIMNELYA